MLALATLSIALSAPQDEFPYGLYVNRSLYFYSTRKSDARTVYRDTLFTFNTVPFKDSVRINGNGDYFTGWRGSTGGGAVLNELQGGDIFITPGRDSITVAIQNTTKTTKIRETLTKIAETQNDFFTGVWEGTGILFVWRKEACKRSARHVRQLCIQVSSSRYRSALIRGAADYSPINMWYEYPLWGWMLAALVYIGIGIADRKRWH